MVTTPTHGSLTGSTYKDGLLWDGWKWTSTSGPVTLDYFFHESSSYSVALGPTDHWDAYEKASYVGATKEWSNVANIKFVETTTYSASVNLDEWLLTNAQMLDYNGGPAGGRHMPPNEASTNGGQAVGVYNTQIASAGYAHWIPAELAPGATIYQLFIHELGHALGLKHPFDTEGAANPFPGVTSGDSGDRGDNDLAHELFSDMAYQEDYGFDVDGHLIFEDGFTLYVDGTSATGTRERTYGVAATPMAFDIAAIQALYGANTSYHTGKNVYVLPDANAAGVAMWRCIWDAGGVDEMRYNGARNAIIDLTAATLDNSPTGGGVLSYAANIYGGYTIANGVMIEKATGGSGNDLITGNAANNVLSGRDGDDSLVGLAGKDTLSGGAGIDTLDGGLSVDKMAGGLGADNFDFNAVLDSGKTKTTWDHITDFKSALDHIDLHDIDADSITMNDQDFTFIGKAAFDHNAGEVRFSLQKIKVGKHFVYNTIVSGDVDGDGFADFAIQLDKHKGVVVGDFVL